MNLSVFIRGHMEEIMQEWMIFAKINAPSDSDMTDLALKDHAQEILITIAGDIETFQSNKQQFDKSQGGKDDNEGDSAASIHGQLRHASNFSLSQLNSEFRALRATVLRLWLPKIERMSDSIAYDMVRFNEAIDQALAESIVTYTARADQTRDLFLAVLGHDLRAPLATVASLGATLSFDGVPPSNLSSIGKKIQRSAMLMSAMVTDLLGFARLQMGAGMPTYKNPINIHEVCEAAVADASSMYPDSKIILRPHDDIVGYFDSVRLHQLLTNLLINAAQFSEKNCDVILKVTESEKSIMFKVTNFGKIIPAHSLKVIFQPLVQLDSGNGKEFSPTTSLGLGLFIANEITKSHDGVIEVTSDNISGTIFNLTFPKIPKKS